MGSDPQSHLEDQNFLAVDGRQIREADWRDVQRRLAEYEKLFESKRESGVFVTGLVAVRDGQPYINLVVNGASAQLTMSQARQVASDITTMSSRTEADAMIVEFFKREGFPASACAALLVQFRGFRRKLDLDRAGRPSATPMPPADKISNRFEILYGAGGEEAIRCLRCNMVSYNSNDVEQRYCGHCKIFHDRGSTDST